MDDKSITKHIFQRLAVILLGFRAVALVSIHDAVHLIEFNSVVGNPDPIRYQMCDAESLSLLAQTSAAVESSILRLRVENISQQCVYIVVEE